MSWATKNEVLKHHRMLTKWEAFLRRGLLSILIGLMLAAFSLISDFISYMLAFASLFFVLFHLFNAFTKQKTQYLSQKSEDTPIFADDITPKKVGTLAIEIVLSGIISLAFVTMIMGSPFWVVLGGQFVVYTGAVFLLCTRILSYLERREMDEFPTDWKDKIILRFLRVFSEARNYFFIGEVAGKKIGLPRALRFLHTLVGAPTGEGKSSSLIIPPLLLDADSAGSAVVPDAKSPELFGWVAGRWIKNGKKVFLFDPWDPDTVGINFLPESDDNDLLTITDVMMREREEILMEKDPFFKSRTKYLLFAILKLVQSFSDEYCNMTSVYHIVQSVDTLTSFVKTAPDVVCKLFDDYDRLYGETKVNALTSIREKMDVFMEANVRRAFSKSEFKLNMLFREKEPCLLILGCPIDKKEPGTKIASLLVNLIVNMAFRERRLQKQAIQKGERSYTPNDLFLYLDELRNLKITALADLVSIARETRTHVISSVTDILFFKYYKEDFSSLMGNHRTRIFMKGLDYDSAKYVSDSLGKVNVATYKYFRGLMASQEQRNVLDPDKVMNLPEDKLIVFSPKTRPFVAKKVSIYKTRWLMKMSVPPPIDMRELYKLWGVASEPLKDTEFPRIDGKLYDLAKIKGNKPSEKLKTNITIDSFHKETFGRGTFTKETSRGSDESTTEEIKRQREEDDEIGGIMGNI